MKQILMTAWRILVAAGMAGIIIIAAIFLNLWYKQHKRDRANERLTYASSYSDSYTCEHYKNTVRLKDSYTGKYLTPKLTFVYDTYAHVKDTLTVFFQNNKRGYLDIYSGQIKIPAQYEKAWIFSEGLGAVIKDDKLGFINKLGDVVIPCRFKYLKDNKNQVDFMFRGGYCTVIGDNNMHGLIDKQGKWVMEPQYDYINNPVKGYRIVKSGNRYGLLDSALNLVLPAENDWLQLTREGVLVVKDGEQQLMDYDCKTVLQSFVFDSIDRLWYCTGETDAHGELISEISSLRSYSIAIIGKRGLYDTRNNKIVTKAIYDEVSAIGSDLFECSLNGRDRSKILVNSKGEVLK